MFNIKERNNKIYPKGTKNGTAALWHRRANIAHSYQNT